VGEADEGNVRRILLLITDLEIGGTPTVVRELATRLRAPPEAEIEVACLKGWGPVADQIRSAGIEVTAFGARRAWQLPSVVRRLRRLVRERGINTVFSFLVHANAVAALASRKLPGVRFIQSIQTIQPRPRWHWWVQRWAAQRAERIVVPSNAIVAFACRHDMERARFVAIPNAVDCNAFDSVEVFRGPKIRAGYLGRLDRAKNPAILIRALEFAAIDEAELHYFGDGPERRVLEAVAMGLEHRVQLRGAVVRPQEALKHMDVLWLPSCVEGFGLVVIEAMASGVPVVACAAGGVLDVVKDRQNGLLVTQGAFAYRQFAASLRTLRDDPALRQRLIENGLRTVRARYSWEVVLPRYRELLSL
jgi:glycosyltransferase involved in cell wall biosynthesis